MANYSFVSNVYGSIRSSSSSRNYKKVPFRSPNPGQLPGTLLNTQSEHLDGVSTLASYNFMAECTSPVRGRTIKEYDQQIEELKHENFNLKLRIFMLEQRVQLKFGDSLDDVHKLNFELQVQSETLKKELSTKKELLVKASAALESLEANHKAEMSSLQQQFSEQQKAWEQQILQLQDPSTHSLSDESHSHHTEFYEQAFLPLNTELPQTSKEMELEKSATELQRKLDEAQNEMLKLQHEYIEKDKVVKQEELNSLKRNKLLQGLVATVKSKEKELMQLKEKYHSLQVEKAGSKEERCEEVKQKSLDSKAKSHDGAVHQKNTVEEFQQENERLQLALQEALSQKDALFETMQSKVDENVREKDETISRMRECIRRRETILHECLKIVGISNSSELLLQEDVKNITDAIRLKVDEKENKTQLALEQKIKLLKERDNEVIQHQAKIGDLEKNFAQLKENLKHMQTANTDLQDQLNQRDLRMQELLDCLSSVNDEFKITKDRHFAVMHDKDALIKRLQESYIISERKLQEMHLSNKENVDASDPNNLQNCIIEKDKLIEEIINDKNRSLVESEHSLQSLSTSLRDKDNIVKDLNDRLVQEQNSRVIERDRMQTELTKKLTEMKNLENQLVVIEGHHQIVVTNIKVALEEKDKTIKSLVESNAQKEKDFQLLLSSHRGNNEQLANVADLKNEIDALSRELNKKKDCILLANEAILRLTTNCFTPEKDESNSDNLVDMTAEAALEQNVHGLEERFSSVQQHSERMNEMFTIANKRIKGLRNLVQKCYGKGNVNGSGDTLSNETDDLLANVKNLLADVKLIINLNNMLQCHLKTNDEALVDDKRKSQLLVDATSQTQQLKMLPGDGSPCVDPAEGRRANASPPVRDSKSPSAKRSKVRSSLTISITPKSNVGSAESFADLGSGSESRPAPQLLEARKEIQTLKDKLSSTENTVHHLGSKVKEYRKRLAELAHNPVTPTSPASILDISCYPTPPSCHAEDEDSRDHPCFGNRRSISAEVVRSSVRAVASNDQALSAEDFLNVVESCTGDLSSLQERRKVRSALNDDSRRGVKSGWKNDPRSNDFARRSSSKQSSPSPYTPDSVNEFGQTDDVLELKEQIFWLKLRFEEHLHELKNAKKDALESEMPSCASNETQTDTCLDNELVEFQHLQQQNSILHMKLDTLLAEIPEGQHTSFIQLQRQEIHLLRNHLGDSHGACELLRIRLEELAEFLEHLLQFDENGALDLSLFTPQRVASLQLQIAKSRELSINLSQSLLVDGDLSMISSCVESTHLYDVTLTDNDSTIHPNQSVIFNKRDHASDSNNEACRYRTSQKIEPSENETGLSTDLAKEPQWKKCDTCNQGKQAHSSYDDLILLLDTNMKGQFKELVDKNQNPSKRLGPDDIRNLASEQEQAIHEYVRKDLALQHKLHKVHQSLKDSYQLMAGELGNVRPGEEKSRSAVSPTDSESWSEPDRDVSQQRMGLEFYSPGEKGSTRSPKSSRHRSLRSESSNTEDILHKPPSGRRGRNDAGELWRQQLRISNLEEANASLRSELEMCHALLKGMETSAKDQTEPSSSPKSKSRTVASVRTTMRKQLFASDAENGSLKDVDSLLGVEWNENLERLSETRSKGLEIHQSELDKDSQVLKMKAEFNRELHALQNQVQMLLEKLQSKDEAVQDLTRSLSTANDADNQLKEANQRLQNSLSQLQVALKDKEIVCHKLGEANARKQNLLDVVDEMMRKQSDQLNSKNSSLKEAEGRAEKHQETIAHFSQLLQDAKAREEENLESLLQTHASEMSELRSAHQNEKESLSRLLDEKETETVQAKQLVDLLRRQATDKEEEMKVLQKNFDEMSAAILQMERHLEAEHGKHLTLQERVNTLNKTIFEKDQNNLALQKRIDELKGAAGRFERENLVCRTQVAELQANFCKCQQELGEKEHQIGALRRCVDKMQDVIVEKKKMLERQLEKARNLAEKVEILSSSATEKEQRCQEECAKKHQLQEKLKQAKEAEVNAKVHAKNQQLSFRQLKDSLAVQEKKYLDLQNKLDERGNVIRKLEEELHQSWEDNERLQQQIVSVQTMLYETNNLSKSMKTELQVYEHLHSSLMSNNSETKDQLTSSQDISELLQEIRSLRAQLELSIQTSCALRHRVEQQLSCRSADVDKHSTAPEEGPRTETAVQSALFGDSGSAVSQPESRNAVRGDDKMTTLGEKLQQSQHFSKISANSIESGQFSDIDVDKQERYADSKKAAAAVPGRKDPNQTTVARKKRPTNLVISKQGCMSGTVDLSTVANDLHSVYSSPDLGIESDPSQFSYLEQQMSMITDKHVWEIRRKSDDQGSDKDDAFACNESDRRLLYTIGRLEDYELLKKEMEEMSKLLKQVHTRIKDRLQYAMTNSPVKDVQQVTWKDVQATISDISAHLQKTLLVVGSFWTAMLPSESGISKAEFEKITQVNSVLRRKVRQQKKLLQEALQKLAASNRLKEGMEKAIMKQLSKTHEVLKKAKGNLEDQTKSPTKVM